MAERNRTEVSLLELRRNLSDYVAAAKDGQEFVVTEWGKPAAMLVPPPKEKDEDDGRG